jgi:2-polyprenyl-3-methyl-5-hydroxy-6-metoxy-1,4-benzoquinol methylase
MKKQLHYYFKYVGHCEMCKNPVANHKMVGQRLNQSQGTNPKNKFGISTSIMQCTNCKLIYSNPMPIPYDLQDHYGVLPEDYWKPEYFIGDSEYFSDQIRRFKTLHSFEKGMRALDVGFGIGKCVISLLEAGFDAYGFEPSKSFYERAISKMGIEESRLKLGMIEEVEYPSESFDFINFGAVLEHFYNPAFCINRAMKWLKPNGLIHIEVPSTNYLVPKFVNWYYKLRGTNYVTNLSPMHDPYHLYEFSLESFKQLASNLSRKFDVVFHEYYVSSAEPFPKFLHGIVNHIMQLTNTGMQLDVWLKKKHE